MLVGKKKIKVNRILRIILSLKFGASRAETLVCVVYILRDVEGKSCNVCPYKTLTEKHESFFGALYHVTGIRAE